MADYLRIDNAQDIEAVYQEIVQIFGKKIFTDPLRAMGAFLDIAPKMLDEAGRLRKAFNAKVPQEIAAASSVDLTKAKELLQKLTAQGVPSDEATDLIENLCRAMGYNISIRPDYSKGGEIPYQTTKTDGIQTAIRKMDHIRWFLNHVDEYNLHGEENEIKAMRKMMNNAQKNEQEIRARYDKLVHQISNDPFSDGFVFHGDKSANGLKCKTFGAYFLVISGAAVPIAFAREYGGSEFRSGIEKLKAKSKIIKAKAANLKDEVTRVTVTKGNSGGKGKAVAYVIVMVLVLYFLNNWFSQRLAGCGIRSIFTALRTNKFAFGRVFSSIPLVSQPKGYITILIVSGLLVLCCVIMIIGLVKTVINISQSKGGGKAAGQKSRLEHQIGTGIPADVDAFVNDIDQYAAGKKQKLDVPHHDYTGFEKKIAAFKISAMPKAYKGALISPKSTKSLGWIIFFAIVLSIMSATQLRSAAMVSASELSGMAGIKQEVKDTVIPSNAMKYADHYYMIYDDAANWWDAKAQCEKMGGHLVTITSEEENNAVKSYASRQGKTSPYIGMVYTDGYWHWLNGEEAVYAGWVEGEPDLGSESDCLYGALYQSDSYQWRALSTDYGDSYICEWDSLDGAKAVDTRVLNIPSGFLWYEGHYYAVLSGAEDYNEAVTMCEDLGGYICTIGSWEENAAIYQYISSKGLIDVHFGYTDQDFEGKWKWTATGEEGGYSCWMEGEPNGGEGENYCMYGTSSGEEYYWVDYIWNSGEDTLFICEWDLSQPAQ